MKPVYRHSLFALVIIAFIVAAPLLILQAQGITFNYTWGASRADFNTEITGIIKVDTNRLFVPISIDGKKAATYRNPANLKGLKSGWHSIEISIDGYLAWQKDVLVESGKISNINDVILIPEELETTKILSLDHKISYVNTGIHPQELRYLSTSGPYTYDFSAKLSNNTAEPPSMPSVLKAFKILNVSPDAYSAMTWSSDHSRLFVAGNNPQNYYFWYVRDDKKLVALSDLTRKAISIEKHLWDFTNANQFYFLTASKDLYFIDFIRDQSLVKLATNVTDFAIGDDSVYFLKNNGRYQNLWERQLTGLENQNILLQLDAKGPLKLSSSKQGLLALIDTSNGELGILKHNGIGGQPYVVQALKSGVQNIFWSTRGTRIFVKTLSGYLIYDLEGPLNVPRITRLSDSISKTDHFMWLPDNNNLIHWNQIEIFIADTNEGKPWLKQLIWSAPTDTQIVNINVDNNFRYLLIHTRSHNKDAVYYQSLSKLDI
ncbi:PEGA domain-containing protein [Patescibacteria group bacterium]